MSQYLYLSLVYFQPLTILSHHSCQVRQGCTRKYSVLWCCFNLAHRQLQHPLVMHWGFQVFDSILSDLSNIDFLQDYFPMSKCTYNSLGVTLHSFRIIFLLEKFVSLCFPIASSVLLMISFLIFILIFIEAGLFVVKLASSIPILCLDIIFFFIIEVHSLSTVFRIVYKIDNTIICWFNHAKGVNWRASDF